MKPSFKKRFDELSNLKSNAPKELKQQRGRDFERLLNDVLSDQGISIKRNYHTIEDKSEEIDGAVWIANRVFLLEVKWVKKQLAASQLYSFIGKIENKFHGTLGIFISRNKLSKNFVKALNRGRRQSVIIIHGDDIDQLFNNDLNFADYIEHTLKVLSCDFDLHYPLKSYIEIKASKQAEPDNSAQTTVKEFITSYLLNGTLDDANLMLAIEQTQQPILDEVFLFALKSYGLVRMNSLKQPIDFRQINNYRLFFAQITPHTATIKTGAERYYSEYLIKNFSHYGIDIFITKFSPLYENLSIDVRNIFEQWLVDLSKRIYGSYDDENKLTEVVAPIWDQLSENTKSKLIDFYLKIYVSDRKPKFIQKTYAIELVQTGKVTHRQIEDWLNTKIIEAKAAYNNITQDVAYSITRAYAPAGTILHETTVEFLKHVKNTLGIKSEE